MSCPVQYNWVAEAAVIAPAYGAENVVSIPGRQN